MPKFTSLRHDAPLDLHPALTNEQFSAALTPHWVQPSTRLPRSAALNEQQVEKRWQQLDLAGAKAEILDMQTTQNMARYEKNIEHFIGTVKVPLGIAGPLRVNGLHAKGDYAIPLATTEAALVASYHRGCRLITRAGGASAMLLNEGVTRTPVFAFANLAQAGQFVGWLTTQYDRLKAIAQSTTRHGRLHDINVSIEGNHVYLVFEYTTGDASGQNMVTIATNAIFEFILAQSPVSPHNAFLDGNLSGDKKANSHVMRSVRGKKVTAEIHIPADLVQKFLHTTPQNMVKFGQMTTIGAALSGGIGVNAHYANALAALYIACGQDAACVAESAVGVTRMEVNQQGGLYACVTLPNIMVGTVGGGTVLPSQQASLDILGLAGPGHARALAEIVASVCLAGELSIVGAFTAGHFSRAHRKLAR